MHSPGVEFVIGALGRNQHPFLYHGAPERGKAQAEYAEYLSVASELIPPRKKAEEDEFEDAARAPGPRSGRLITFGCRNSEVVMTDYATLSTSGSRDAQVPFDRPNLSSGVCTEAADGRVRMQVSAVAAEVQDPVFGCVWQDRRCLRKGSSSVCEGAYGFQQSALSVLCRSGIGAARKWPIERVLPELVRRLSGQVKPGRPNGHLAVRRPEHRGCRFQHRSFKPSATSIGAG